MHPSAISRGAILSAAGVILIFVGIFRLTGGSWFVVETPSMGTAAPVGSLLIDVPARPGALRLGDVITFHVPNGDGVYTHRIVGASSAGFVTRGDINGGADSWRIPAAAVIGRAVVIIPGLGWGVRAIPFVAAALLLMLLATRKLRAGPRRRYLRLLGSLSSLALTGVVLKPFAAMRLLQMNVTDGAVSARVTATGLLPITVQAEGAKTAHLMPGEAGVINVARLPADHRILLTSALDLPAWGWLVLLLISLLPIAGTLWYIRFESRRAS